MGHVRSAHLSLLPPLGQVIQCNNQLRQPIVVAKRRLYYISMISNGIGPRAAGLHQGVQKNYTAKKVCRDKKCIDAVVAPLGLLSIKSLQKSIKGMMNRGLCNHISC